MRTEYTHPKIICFDIDGTLADGNSWLILSEGLGVKVSNHMDLFKQASTGEITFVDAEKVLTGMYQKSGRATQENIEHIFSAIQPRSEAFHLISQLHEEGYIVYCVSGGIDVYVQAVAQKLSVDGWYANSSLQFDARGVLQRIVYRPDQAQVKAEQLADLTKKHGILITDIVFVGDGWNDIEVFKKTGKGIAVNCQNRELQKVAWKEAASLDEIPRLLRDI